MDSKYNVLIICVTVFLSVIAFIGYQVYSDNEKYKNDQIKSIIDEQSKSQLAKDNEEKYLQCQIQAYEEYRDAWWANCSNHGTNIDKKKKTCSLPSYNADSLNKSNKEALDRCVQLYK